MILSRKEKLKEMQRIKEFLEEVSLTAEIMDDAKEEYLLMGVPTEEKEKEENGIRNEQVHQIMGWFLDVDVEEVEFAKLFRFSYIMPIILETMSESDILRLINEFNTVILLGNFVYYIDDIGEKNIRLDYTLMFQDDVPIEESLVCESLYTMFHYGNMMEYFLLGILSEQFTIEEVIRLLKTGGVDE